MNIKELLQAINEILEDKTGGVQDLYEFALNRKKVKDKIESWSDVIVDHICKIVYLRHIMKNTVHHWYAEIVAQLNNIVQIQMKGGDLKQSTLLQWMRNGLNTPKEMENRRYLVAMQEDIDISMCKELEDIDYDTVMSIIKSMVNLVLYCKNHHLKIIIGDVEEIFNEN